MRNHFAWDRDFAEKLWSQAACPIDFFIGHVMWGLLRLGGFPMIGGWK
jgi:hypothetical protein